MAQQLKFDLTDEQVQVLIEATELYMDDCNQSIENHDSHEELQSSLQDLEDIIEIRNQLEAQGIPVTPDGLGNPFDGPSQTDPTQTTEPNG